MDVRNKPKPVSAPPETSGAGAATFSLPSPSLLDGTGYADPPVLPRRSRDMASTRSSRRTRRYPVAPTLPSPTPEKVAASIRHSHPASEPDILRLAVSQDRRAPAFVGVGQVGPDRAAELQLLNDRQEQYLSEVQFRPIRQELLAEVKAMKAEELQKPIPANRGYWMIDPLMKGYDRLRGRERPPKREMGPIADKMLDALDMPHAKVWSSFRAPAMVYALPPFVPDAINTAFLALNTAFGHTTAKAAGFVVAQFLTNLAIRFPMGYATNYSQYNAELAREFGSANRSRRIKDVPPIADSRRKVNALLRNATAPGKLSANATPEDIALHEGLLQELTDAMLDHAIGTQDNNTYYIGKEKASLVGIARQALLYALPTALRLLVYPNACHLAWHATGASVGTIWGIRALQTLGSAPVDEKAKQRATLAMTIEHTDLSTEKAVRDLWRTKAATRMDHAEQDIQGRLAADFGRIGRLLGVRNIDIEAFEKAGGFGEQVLTGLLTDPERARLHELRQALSIDDADDVSRDVFLEYIDLERKSQDTDPEDLQAMKPRYKSSTMSAFSWRELEAPRGGLQGGASSPGSLESLDIGEPAMASYPSESVATGSSGLTRTASQQSRELGATLEKMSTEDQALEFRISLRPQRSEASLKPRQHARYVGLTARRRYWRPETHDRDFAGAERTRTAIRELEESGDPRKLQRLRELVNSVIAHRLDENVLRWDWTKLSEPAQSRMHDLFVSGKSSFELAVTSARWHVNQARYIVPAWLIQIGGAAYGVVLNPTGPLIVNGALKAYALSKPALRQCVEGVGPSDAAKAFYKLQAEAKAGLLIVSFMASMVAVQSVYNAQVRRAFNPKNNPGQETPSAARIFGVGLPNVLLKVYYDQIKERLILGPWHAQAPFDFAEATKASLARLRPRPKVAGPEPRPATVSGPGPDARGAPEAPEAPIAAWDLSRVNLFTGQPLRRRAAP